MPVLSDLSKDERTLLLFLEACATDRGGLVDVRHMNADDHATVKRWSESGFVAFGRLRFADIKESGGKTYAHWCRLSDEAWALAHAERRARCERIYGRRTWEAADKAAAERVG